jgi:hypothetical protein
MEAIQRLVTFVGLEISPAQLVALAQIPQRPPSAGRHAREDLSQFSRVALERGLPVHLVHHLAKALTRGEGGKGTRAVASGIRDRCSKARA